MSTERWLFGMPRLFSEPKAASDPATGREGPESRGVQEPMHARTHGIGTWEVFMPSRCRGGIAEERETAAEDARHEEVRLGHSSREVGEQGGDSPCGADGAKGRAQGESGSQSTRRAQDRASVSQAADRIRHLYNGSRGSVRRRFSTMSRSMRCAGRSSI